ncbi:DUF3948 family protein [Bacillus sp. NPDC077411]|uniref:DUF3948 family protein n=1 Tax=Bacillus bruguierae TaxID=3127667 RepID=A0ABU8FNV4_9BACI|nr:MULTISPECIES: DUF3948 family protein [unclassified Bacillus (in: firmicutes)]SFJ47515.1 Protein of unknown function [Bacillus sp. 71mf]SFT18413.1 Protein of unknown function [Bacillus sp. 103mf]
MNNITFNKFDYMGLIGGAALLTAVVYALAHVLA